MGPTENAVSQSKIARFIHQEASALGGILVQDSVVQLRVHMGKHKNRRVSSPKLLIRMVLPWEHVQVWGIGRGDEPRVSSSTSGSNQHHLGILLHVEPCCQGGIPKVRSGEFSHATSHWQTFDSVISTDRLCCQNVYPANHCRKEQ